MTFVNPDFSNQFSSTNSSLLRLPSNTPAEILILVCMLGFVWLLMRRVTGRSMFFPKSILNNSKTKVPSTDFSRQQRKMLFLDMNKEKYGYRGTPGGYIDHWRHIEFPSLLPPLEHQTVEHQQNSKAEVYLDYAGSALPTQSQLKSVLRISSGVLANPHSTGPAASRTMLGIERVKQRILQYFKAHPGRFASLSKPPPLCSPEQSHPGYHLVFTSGTTEGLRQIGERFPWRKTCECGRTSLFLYARNSHNSVVGIRNLVTQRGGKFMCRNLNDLLDMTSDDFNDISAGACPSCERCRDDKIPNLVAIPAECNFAGTKVDVAAFVQKVRKATGWYCLIDVAKAASSGPVALREMDADMAVLSFYKMFGEPTGLGCIFVKQSLVGQLFTSTTSHLHYQGGGSVDLLLPDSNVCVPRKDGLSSWVSGTVNFRGILSLEAGFDELDKRGGACRIRDHACSLAKEFCRKLYSLRHGNNRSVAKLYGAWASRSHDDDIGPTVSFNVFRSDGSIVGFNEVSKLAAFRGIQFRTGCFCNPGACQESLHLSDKQSLDNYRKSGKVCGDHLDVLDGKPTGAIRVSFGKDSLWEDLDSIVQFLVCTFVDARVGKSVPAIKMKGPDIVTVTQMFLFPIKSCASQRVSRWKIDSHRGKLLYDREFAIVDTAGRAMRLQACPKMTTITPSIDLETESMILSAPGMANLVIHLNNDSAYHDGLGTVKVCGNKCGGQLWGDYEASEWLSCYLGVQCWLARFIDGHYRVHQHRDPILRSGFSNEAALLLISENAVTALNRMLQENGQEPVGSRHFRPNLVVRSSSKGAHMEDEWKVIETLQRELSFEMKGHCARCSMVDFDPTTGKRGKTLKALARYRRREGQITFGIFLRAITTQSEIWIEEGIKLHCS